MDETTTENTQLIEERIAFVAAGKYRRPIISILDEGPETPSRIATELDTTQSAVSRAITKLRKRDLVTLLVPEETKRGRVFRLTEDGEEIVDRLGIRDVESEKERAGLSGLAQDDA